MPFHFRNICDTIPIMNCRGYMKNFTSFLNDELPERKARLMLKHLNSCHTCREEMRIQYILQEGMHRLEFGGTLDINSDFEKMISEREKKLRNNRLVRFIKGIAMTAALFVTAYFLASGLLL